jgi:hypothetical protein
MSFYCHLLKSGEISFLNYLAPKNSFCAVLFVDKKTFNLYSYSWFFTPFQLAG